MGKPHGNDAITIIAELERLKKERRGRKTYSIDRYFKRKVEISDLYYFVDESKIKKRSTGESVLKKHAKANFVVNQVAAFEIFLKELIVEAKERWQENGIKLLLNGQITLHDAFILCNNTQVQKVDLIALSSSFQNLESIDKVFGALTGTKFLNSIDSRLFEILTKDGGELSPSTKNWRAHMARTFELRHKIIHEGYYFPIHNDHIEHMEHIFVMIPAYMFSHIAHLPKQP